MAVIADSAPPAGAAISLLGPVLDCAVDCACVVLCFYVYCRVVRLGRALLGSGCVGVYRQVRPGPRTLGSEVAAPALGSRFLRSVSVTAPRASRSASLDFVSCTKVGAGRVCCVTAAIVDCYSFACIGGCPVSAAICRPRAVRASVYVALVGVARLVRFTTAVRRSSSAKE